MNKKLSNTGLSAAESYPTGTRAISEIENAEFLGVTDVVEAARKSFAEKYGAKRMTPSTRL